MRGRAAAAALAVLVLVSTAAAARAAAAPLAPGDRAPVFALADQHGRAFTLADALQHRRWIVLAFYPRAFTGG